MLNVDTFDWTPEKVADLKKLWLDGFSAQQIAQVLNVKTRSAVLGKIHRIGLSKKGPRRGFSETRKRPRTSGVCQLERTVLNLQPRKSWSVSPVPEPKIQPELPKKQPEPIAPAVAGGISMADLEPHHCRFPITGDDTKDHRYCGHRKAAGISWCEHHAKIVFAVTPVRTRPDSLFIERRLHKAYA